MLQSIANDVLLENMPEMVKSAYARFAKASPLPYPYDAFKELYLQAGCLRLNGVTTYRPNAVTGAVLSDRNLCLRDLSGCAT